MYDIHTLTNPHDITPINLWPVLERALEQGEEIQAKEIPPVGNDDSSPHLQRPIMFDAHSSAAAIVIYVLYIIHPTLARLFPFLEHS